MFNIRRPESHPVRKSLVARILWYSIHEYPATDLLAFHPGHSCRLYCLDSSIRIDGVIWFRAFP